MSNAKPQEITYGSLSSSKIPNLKLITTHFLHRVAARCDLGIERKGDKAYNALSPHTDENLKNLDFAIERCSHVIGHALNLRDKLAKAKHGQKFDLGDDDPAAIGWNAMYLCEVTRALQTERLNCSACGGIGSITASQTASDSGSITYTYKCPACKGSGKAGK